jgi:enoyl-[acyl-carrier protein] reductase II
MKPLINQLFQIRYPIISGGMVWVSGGKLAAAVSEAGGLGLIGAGSMKPDLLKTHILKAQSLTKKPLGVNVPLLYEGAEIQIQTALDLGIKIFFTSAGSPKKMTSFLKKEGALVVHVTSSPELALKCEDAGVDAIVAEGFEAGGHNGREEITTMALVPQVVSQVKIPVIAAGGIATGSAIAAALSLGASGVQLGTRFLMSHESSAHDAFKDLCLKATPGSTKLLMKSTVPVRLLDNPFSSEIKALEQQFTGEELKIRLLNHLGKMRAKSGMLDGDINEGELEVGQIISHIKEIKSVADIMESLITEYNQTLQTLSKIN